MRYKGFSARIEFDEEDAIFTGRVAGIDDIVGFHATTVDDLKAAFHEAVDDYVEGCARTGKEPAKPAPPNRQSAPSASGSSDRPR